VLEVLIRLREESGNPGASITSAAVYDRLRGRLAFQRSEAVSAALRFLQERRYVTLTRRDGPGPQTYSVFLNPLYTRAEMRSPPDFENSAPRMATISHLRSPYGKSEKHSAAVDSQPDPLLPTGTDEWSMEI
jgi:hypothetical protein